jgi:hypothetical protein
VENEKRFLTKAEIKAVKDIEIDELYVPEWKGWVHVRGLNGTQRALINGTAIATRGVDVSLKADALAEQQLRIAAACLVDEDGKQFYSIKEFAELGEKSAGAVQRVYEKASELSGTKPDAVEETAENSDAAQSESSS